MTYPWFVYLESEDKHLESLLLGVRAALRPQLYRDTIHITIQGPFPDRPDDVKLHHIESLLRDAVITVAGTKILSSARGYVLALVCASPIFRKIWWKPDFNDLDSIIPHVSLYESANLEAVQTAEKFLNQQNIRLNWGKSRVTRYQTKSPLRDFLPHYSFTAKEAELFNLPANFMTEAEKIGKKLAMIESGLTTPTSAPSPVLKPVHHQEQNARSAIPGNYAIAEIG